MNKIYWSIIYIFISNLVFANDPIRNSVETSLSAMHAQGKRLEVIASNLANSDSTGLTPGAEPYKRKTISFKNYNDRNHISKVKISKISHDNSHFIKKYEPNHPAADSMGYVLYPNVNSVIESADAREAQLNYNANLSSIEIARTITSKTLDILR